MKTFLICLAFFAAQMNTLQDKPVVHLQPHRNIITTDFDGDLLELINAPAVVNLPAIPPKANHQGRPWSVDVRNLGPGAVTVVGSGLFSVRINLGKTVHILSNGTAYSLQQ